MLPYEYESSDDEFLSSVYARKRLRSELEHDSKEDEEADEIDCDNEDSEESEEEVRIKFHPLTRELKGLKF